MEVQSGSQDTLETLPEEAQGHSPEGLALPQGSGYTPLVEAFALGYGAVHSFPSVRAVNTLNLIVPWLEQLDDELSSIASPVSVAEAFGAQAGLNDRLRNRLDRLEKKYDTIIRMWAERFSVFLPTHEIFQALREYSGSFSDQSRAGVLLRKKLKREMVHHLQSVFLVFPELEEELRSIIRNSYDEAAAEGKTSAASVVHLQTKGTIPSLNDTRDGILRQLAGLAINTTPIVKIIVSGLAGDVALNRDSITTPKDIRTTVAKGDGAAFYLGDGIHTFYTTAQLDHFSDAGQLVNFTTMGDEKVDGACIAAASRNPYRPEDAPPIPLHADCRCWYTAAGTPH